MSRGATRVHVTRRDARCASIAPKAYASSCAKSNGFCSTGRPSVCQTPAVASSESASSPVTKVTRSASSRPCVLDPAHQLEPALRAEPDVDEERVGLVLDEHLLRARRSIVRRCTSWPRRSNHRRDGAADGLLVIHVEHDRHVVLPTAGESDVSGRRAIQCMDRAPPTVRGHVGPWPGCVARCILRACSTSISRAAARSSPAWPTTAGSASRSPRRSPRRARASAWAPGRRRSTSSSTCSSAGRWTSRAGSRDGSLLDVREDLSARRRVRHATTTMPEDLRTSKRYKDVGDCSIDGLAQRLVADFGERPLDIVVHSLANGPEVKKPLLETSAGTATSPR